MENQPILKIEDLSISFQTSAGEAHVIRGVNFTLHRGETVAIVGESGSGKSVTVKAVMGILSGNGRINSGKVFFTHEQDGQEVTHDLLTFSKKQMRQQINGKRIAMVFQDPMTSLNPTMSIGAQLMEGMIHHDHLPKAKAREKAIRLLELVGITDPEKRMRNYPHQLSGGMRQRVVIAIALACHPDLLICDEPTTALDVTIQAKILELIKDIQQRMGISVIYITHDLGVVAKVADFVEVMYAARWWNAAPRRKSSTIRAIPTPGDCCPPCRISTAARTSSTPSPAVRRTCCIPQRATRSRPAIPMR
jgi:oligopeptide transport system ATP-binding protein